jgi:hypothetical protein
VWSSYLHDYTLVITNIGYVIPGIAGVMTVARAPKKIATCEMRHALERGVNHDFDGSDGVFGSKGRERR